MMVVLIHDLDREQAQTFSLVLHSAGIGHRVVGADDRLRIDVPAPLVDDAREAIGRYRAENPPTSAEPAVLSDRRQAINRSGVAVAVVLLAAHLAVWFSGVPEDYVAAFGANARRIVHGEWYRCITALLLHADTAHLAGNMAGMALFGGSVGAMAGNGVGWLIILACGFLGNLVNAWFHETGHLSIGASTAVFGAVGILCARQAIDARKAGSGWKGCLKVFGAGAALLAFLGTQAGSDLGAHLFGFTVGLLAGSSLGWWLHRCRGRYSQLLGGIAAAAIIVLAWMRGY